MKIVNLLIICTLIVTSVLIAGCGGEETTTTEAVPTVTVNGQELGPVKAGDTVAVHYVGTLGDGTQFDSSHDRGETLGFTVGAGQMIMGFDNAVVGMKVGEIKTVTLPPEEAYGPYLEELLIEFSRDELPEDLQNPQVGNLVILTLQTGGTIQKPIVEVTDTYITVDANHELAGEALTFEIELVSIESGE